MRRRIVLVQWRFEGALAACVSDCGSGTCRFSRSTRPTSVSARSHAVLGNAVRKLPIAVPLEAGASEPGSKRSMGTGATF